MLTAARRESLAPSAPSAAVNARTLDQTIAQRDRAQGDHCVPLGESPPEMRLWSRRPARKRENRSSAASPEISGREKEFTKKSCTADILVPENAAKDALAERSKAVAQGAIP